MPKQFQLVTQFSGYQHKRDVTNMAPGVLVVGSQNVLSTDGDRIASRKGYTLTGAANASLYPIVSSYEWMTHRGTELALRSWNDRIEFLYGTTWYTLATGFTSVAFNWAEFWDTTEVQDLLLFVNGTSNIYSWSGAYATFASATAATVTLQGTTTWAESGFLVAGTRQIIIGGVTATYTGGEGTTTLTGVSVDFSATAVGTLIYQAMRTQANSAITSTNVNFPATFKNDLIAVLTNQVYIGSLTSRAVYISKVNSFSDFSRSAPRAPAEGENITLDATTTGFVVQEEAMYMSAGLDQWYLTVFTPSADLTKESLSVKRLKTSSQQAARSQAAIAKIKNEIVFISKEPTLDTLGRVEQITTPQTKPLSDPIKTDFDSYNFTNVHLRFHKSFLYIALPGEGLVLIRNLEKGFWEAPQTLPISRFSVISGELYGHSSQVPETYKMFTGYNDNGNSIRSIAAFSYQNFGDRVKQKSFTEFYTEGYIDGNTEITLQLNYDYGGFTQIAEDTISGQNSAILFQPSSEDYSLGAQSLGSASLGGGGGEVEELPPKFREIHTIVRQDYFEEQTVYISDGVDQRWELLAFGPSVSASAADSVSIKD